MGRRRGGLGDLCSRRGLVRRDAPPILFLVAPKRERAAPGVREKGALAATLHVRAKLLYGGRREMVPAGLRWLPDGRGGVRYRLDGGFPRRGCVLGRGARTHLTSSSFRAFRFATRCPGIRRGRCPHRPAAEAFINHRPAAAKISAACIPDFPGLEGFTRAGRFPL